MRLRLNETGNIYGRLTVKEKAPDKGKYSRWLCQCSCGNHTIVIGADLRSGATQSCGCLHRERLMAALISKRKAA
jgi:hypothetical protein